MASRRSVDFARAGSAARDTRNSVDTYTAYRESPRRDSSYGSRDSKSSSIEDPTAKFEKGRIQVLQQERVHIQKKTFTKWCNSFLEKVSSRFWPPPVWFSICVSRSSVIDIDCVEPTSKQHNMFLETFASLWPRILCRRAEHVFVVATYVDKTLNGVIEASTLLLVACSSTRLSAARMYVSLYCM